MPTVKNSTWQNGQRFTIGMLVSVALLFISVGGLIWQGSEINTKANVAYAHTQESKALPEKVKNLEESMKKLNTVPTSIAVMQEKMESMCKQLEEIKEELKEIKEKIR